MHFAHNNYSQITVLERQSHDDSDCIWHVRTANPPFHYCSDSSLGIETLKQMYGCQLVCVCFQVCATLCLQVNEVKDKVELQPPRGVHAKAARKKGEDEAAPVKKAAKPKKEEKEEKGEDSSTEPPPKPKKKKAAKKVSPFSGGLVVVSAYLLSAHT